MSNITIFESNQKCRITIVSTGSEKLESIPGLIILGVFGFLFLNVFGIVLTIIFLSGLNFEEIITVDKQEKILRADFRLLFHGSVISTSREVNSLEEVNLFTDEIRSSPIVKVTLTINSSKGRKSITFRLVTDYPRERSVYNTLLDLFQTMNPVILGSQSHPTSSAKPNLYAANITITDDEMTYKRTIATSKELWRLYWSITFAITLIIIGFTGFILGLLPLIRFQPTWYGLHIPLGLILLGLTLKGVHTIVSAIIATKLSEMIHFNRLARVVRIEDKFLISQSSHKYLFEQVELKIETIHSDSNSNQFTKYYAVVLNCNKDRDDARKLELVSTSRQAQAQELYNSLAEILQYPLI